MNIIRRCRSVSRVQDSGLTYLIRDNVFTWSIPVLRRSAMMSRHVVCLWKNTTRMWNKYLELVTIVWQE